MIDNECRSKFLIMIDKIVFKYLNDKNFSILKSKKDIFFVENKDDEYAQIRLRNDGVCFIYWRLVVEISDFFSLQSSDSKSIIGKWVGNTLQTEVTSTRVLFYPHYHWVGNTLQTEVTSTNHSEIRTEIRLEIPYKLR